MSGKIESNEIICNNYKHPLYYGRSSELKDWAEFDCFRFLLIENGTVCMYMNEKELLIDGPALVCMNEQDMPEFKEMSLVSFRYIYFYPELINPKLNYDNTRDINSDFSIVEQQDCFLLMPFLNREDAYNGIVFLESNTLHQVSKLFEAIRKEVHEPKDGYWPCRSRSYLLELLILTIKLVEANRKLDEKNPVPENVANIITFLHNNYSDKITLDQLATKFTTNRTTINDQFYKATNLSIIDYLIKLRVQLAATMLRDTLIPISEIMSRVGFHDSSHFWRTFKKHTSLSPKEYREKYCWIED